MTSYSYRKRRACLSALAEGLRQAAPPPLPSPLPPAGDTKPEPSGCGSGLERRRKGAGEECPRLGVPNKADFTPTTFHVKHPAPSPPLFCKPCYAPIGNHLK